MKLISYLSRMVFILASRAAAQSFIIDTDTIVLLDGYKYSFTLKYIQDGSEGSLTEPIWSWMFSIPTDFGEPTEILSPDGWQFIYDPNYGDCTWFTEGPEGWAMGDFGNYIITPGGSLSGFSFRTPLEPAYGLAVATDTAYSEDYAIALLPQVAPVPEPASIASLALGLVWITRRCRRH